MDAHLEALHDALADSRHGAITVAIVGPARSGKSTLLRRFVDEVRAEQDDTVIFTSRADPRERLPLRVTDQIDAMRVMAVDPLRVLVAPRVVACIVMIPILTVASNLCGAGGGWFVTTKLFGVNPEAYWDFTRIFVDWFDVMNGLVKSVFFGTAIGVISCYKGFRCRSGAQGVGRATTEAFVASFVVIVIINLVLANLLNEIDALRLGTRQ